MFLSNECCIIRLAKSYIVGNQFYSNIIYVEHDCAASFSTCSALIIRV